MAKKYLFTSFVIAVMAMTAVSQEFNTQNPKISFARMEQLELTPEWDKTFPKSDKVKHSKVTFVNRFGITLAADMYVPADATGRLPAIAVSGPFGAVKEQSSGLYAQTLAERGFLTIAFDPSYTGESGGMPRYVASPDINTEDFSAAVDFLSTFDSVDPARIGILGVCGWGGFAINAAANDPRIKATVASTMYDISRCIRLTATSMPATMPMSDTKCVADWRLKELRIIATVLTRVREVLLTRCPMMLRSLSKTIMRIIRLPVATISARLTPTQAGT